MSKGVDGPGHAEAKGSLQARWSGGAGGRLASAIVAPRTPRHGIVSLPLDRPTAAWAMMVSYARHQVEKIVAAL
jgi:hypothetical protein